MLSVGLPKHGNLMQLDSSLATKPTAVLDVELQALKTLYLLDEGKLIPCCGLTFASCLPSLT